MSLAGTELAVKLFLKIAGRPGQELFDYLQGHAVESSELSL
jgi:hypothetical protein